MAMTSRGRPWAAAFELLALAIWLMACAPAFAMQSVQDPGTAVRTRDVPRIGVMTMEPGKVFFERFGHDSLIVDDPAGGEAISYNFGFFNLDEPGFIGNFARGIMTYQLVALPLAEDVEQYRQAGRGVSIQWLALTPDEARSLATALSINARPENARYRYEYFTDNCATRVRDAINTVLGGRLKKQLEGRSRGNTYRAQAVRMASPAPWMWLGFDVGLGPAADQPLSVWADSFIPTRLAEALREVNGSGGEPLVASEIRLLPQRIAAEPADDARVVWPWLLAGIGIAILALLVAHRRPRAVAAMALPFWLLCTVIGGLMVFLWAFTDHRFAWGNHNLLLFSPLCLLALPGGLRIARGRHGGAWFDRWLWVFAIAPVVALFMHWLSAVPQQNAAWLALMLPIHVALLFALRRR